MKRYVKERETLPVQPPEAGERTEDEELFARLAATIEKPEKRDRAVSSWIRPGTWALVDRRASLRKQGTLTRWEGRKLGREIKRALKADRIERARRAGEAAMMLLAGGEAKEAWRTVRGWYRQAEGRAPKPCHHTMARQTREREELYARRDPPGNPPRAM